MTHCLITEKCDIIITTHIQNDTEVRVFAGFMYVLGKKIEKMSVLFLTSFVRRKKKKMSNWFFFPSPPPPPRLLSLLFLFLLCFCVFFSLSPLLPPNLRGGCVGVMPE